ncbi:phage tail protein [Enterococcus faecium]|uniref:phage tail spike protein n=2 Tax=Enterococcus faecium TaxID=1352 RepID=UPI000DE95A24|nr:phage tail spike protein [Enterococcus faecium]EKY8185618.1 phage tail protein [Enterococcus faecium]EME8064483.1 phage tail protein [Enterococcus faecium]EMF0382307.1 phage tail protein [Enterococcus faecium]NTL72601.1 phage tail protein [Enterococcus faecium]RBS34363.1 phage minor structural protein [Enterococcus faecium]
MIDNLITIYDKNDANNLAEHLYDTQGLGALSDWLTATVSNKLNGAEIFQGTYPISGTNADLIVEGRIIQCYVDENRAKQRLRIYYAKTSVIGNTIEVKAEPIFNDIRKSVLNKYDSGTEKITATQAWQNAKVLAKPAIPSQFSFSSLVDTLANVKIEKANFLEFFGGKEGSILDRFHGEFLKDNNTLRHETRLGTDHKIKAIYTKNLTGLDLEIDAQSVLVGVYPFISSSSEGEDEITLPEEVIFTDYVDDYPAGYVSFVDFKDKATDVATLREAAKDWLKTNIDKQKPQVSGSIELVPLRHQRGYEKFVDLEKVSMGDGVDVYHPQLKVNMSARIVEYTFNVLTNSYDKLVVGNVKTNFLENTENNVSNLINDAIDQLKNGGEISDLINDIVDHQTDMITGQNGGYVLLDPKEAPSRILIMDTPDKNTARNVLQINNAGIGFSKTGINGTYDTAWTLDGGFNASFITAGEIVGITIRGTTLISDGTDYRTSIANGKMTWYSKKVNKDIMELEARDYVSADAGIVSYTMKTGGGFMIRNPQGNLVFSTWDNGNNRPFLSFGAPNFRYSNASYINDGDGNSLGIDGSAGNSWEFKVAGRTMKFTSDGMLTLPGCFFGSWEDGKLARFEQSTVQVYKDFTVRGTKNSTVPTEHYGQRLLNAYETPEYYFADYGEAVTGDDGKVRVDIDPMFAETVNLSRYMTHVTPTELVLCAVTHEDIDHFIIETSKPNVLVRWNLVAHRLGYEDIRLKEDTAYDSTVLDQKRF